MASETVDLSLAAFCAGLAQETPRPSAGGLCAVQAAAGASLASMAFRMESGETQAAGPFPAGRADELDELRDQALELIGRDEAAFGAVLAAEGDEALRPALAAALEVPFETMELALGALRLVAVGAPQAAAGARADCLAAGAALWSAIEGGAALVRANAEALERAGGEPQADALAEVEAMRAEAAGLLGEARAAAGLARPPKAATPTAPGGPA